nr:MAG TPA: hypothetical protein [Caudoviricetes sp.]
MFSKNQCIICIFIMLYLESEQIIVYLYHILS